MRNRKNYMIVFLVILAIIILFFIVIFSLSFYNKPKIIHEYILFNQIPDSSQKEILRQNGANLIDYLEENTYITSIQIEKLRNIKQLPFVISVYEIKPENKAPFSFSEMNLPVYAISEDGGYNLIVEFYKDVPEDKAKNAIERYGGIITNIFDYDSLKGLGELYNFTWNYERTPRAGVKFFDNNSIYGLASEDIVKYIAPLPPPAIPASE